MNWAELSYELGRVVLVRDFIGPSGLVRVVFGPSCPAPVQTLWLIYMNIDSCQKNSMHSGNGIAVKLSLSR